MYIYLTGKLWDRGQRELIVRMYNIRVRPRFVDLLSLQLGRSFIYISSPFFPLSFFLFSFPSTSSSHVAKKRGEAKDGEGGAAIESNRFENLIGGKHGKSITNFWIAIVSRRTSNINTFSFRYLYQWGNATCIRIRANFPGIRGTLRQRRKIRHLVSDSIYNPPALPNHFP